MRLDPEKSTVVASSQRDYIAASRKSTRKALDDLANAEHTSPSSSIDDGQQASPRLCEKLCCKRILKVALTFSNNLAEKSFLACLQHCLFLSIKLFRLHLTLIIIIANDRRLVQSEPFDGVVRHRPRRRFLFRLEALHTCPEKQVQEPRKLPRSGRAPSNLNRRG